MINTYNESNLHLTLKKLYALEYNGKTEQNVDNWICDIVTEKGDIIEIQTANVSKLAKKTKTLLEKGRRVTIVYPIIIKKTIETYSIDGQLLSRRKSPKRATIYSLFRELTGIYTVLLQDNFTLEVLFITVVEQRRKTSEPTQLNNKSRRFLKDWVPQGKFLEAIQAKQRFCSINDYAALLPAELTEPFNASMLKKAISALPEIQALSISNRNFAATQAHLMLWLYTRMDILEEAGFRGRSKLYMRK